MSLDILFVSHNRRKFTEASLTALADNTDWDLVRRIVLMDDASIDGTKFAVQAHADHWAAAEVVDVTFRSEPLGGPVAAMSAYLDDDPADQFVKIDSDVIVPPGWLNVLAETARRNDTVDVLGFELGFGKHGIADCNGTRRRAQKASHVGGVGLIRSKVFEGRDLKQHDRFFGWTEYQRRYCRCAWLDPDIPAFLLDHLPFEPWLSLSREYVAKGWMRDWRSHYPPGYSAAWEWWLA